MIKRLVSGMDFFYPDAARDAPSAAQWAVLDRTTALIPEAHRNVISHVEVRGSTQAPRTGGGSIVDAHIIRLSHACLAASYNRTHNVTLLHEAGHHVDWHYGVVAFARTQGADGSALLATGHDGATQGAGERIADCYMVYLLQTIAGVPYQHPADRAAYRGAEAQRRFRVLLASPAGAAFASPATAAATP